MRRTLTRLLGGHAISAGELARLIRTPDGVVALAALSRAHIDHQRATAELKRPPRQATKKRAVTPNPEGKKGLKSTRPRKI